MKDLLSIVRTNKAAIATLVVGAALFYCMMPFLGFDWLYYNISISFNSYTVGLIAARLVYTTPAILALFIIHKPKDIVDSMGLNKPFFFAFLLSLIFLLPLIVGDSFTSKLTIPILWFDTAIWYIFYSSISQLIIVGFLFGQLFRYAGWGFISILLLLIPLAFTPVFDIYYIKTETLAQLFFETGVSILFYALYFWLYAEWKYNIWIPICMAYFIYILHIFYNTYIESQTGWLMHHIALLLTLAVAVVTTIAHKKRNKIPFVLTTHNLWINKQTEAC